MNLTNLATAVCLLVSVGFPALSALVTRNPVVAGFVTPLLSAVAGLVTEWSRNPVHFAWGQAIVTAVTSYAVAVLAHYGYNKGPVAARLHAVGSRKTAA